MAALSLHRLEEIAVFRPRGKEKGARLPFHVLGAGSVIVEDHVPSRILHGPLKAVVVDARFIRRRLRLFGDDLREGMAHVHDGDDIFLANKIHHGVSIHGPYVDVRVLGQAITPFFPGDADDNGSVVHAFDDAHGFRGAADDPKLHNL